MHGFCLPWRGVEAFIVRFLAFLVASRERMLQYESGPWKSYRLLFLTLPIVGPADWAGGLESLSRYGGTLVSASVHWTRLRLKGVECSCCRVTRDKASAFVRSPPFRSA